MKIEWIGEEREVPKVGLMTSGDIRDVPDEIADSLIKQGMAIKFKTEKKKGGDN